MFAFVSRKRVVYSCHAMAVVVLHPHNAWTDHAEFSPTRQTLIACTKPEAKREVLGEPHEMGGLHPSKNMEWQSPIGLIGGVGLVN